MLTGVTFNLDMLFQNHTVYKCTLNLSWASFLLRWSLVGCEGNGCRLLHTKMPHIASELTCAVKTNSSNCLLFKFVSAPCVGLWRYKEKTDRLTKKLIGVIHQALKWTRWNVPLNGWRPWPCPDTIVCLHLNMLNAERWNTSAPGGTIYQFDLMARNSQPLYCQPQLLLSVE